MSFLLFYSAYSKALKTLDSRLLIEIITFNKGLDYSFVQLNKVIALTAVSLVSLAFCPGIGHTLCQDLLVAGFAHVVAHALYSTVKYYGTSNIPAVQKFPKMPAELVSSDPKIRGKGIKKASVLLGIMAELALIAVFYDYLGGYAVAGTTLISLSVAHFYTMEIDQQLVLQVRPYALLCFPLALAGLINAALKW